MNRRTFLKSLSAGLYAAAAPAILLPTRTVIDLNPASYRDDWAYLQGMIDQAARDGRELTIANGEYVLSQPLIFRAGAKVLNNFFLSDYPSGVIVAVGLPVITGTFTMVGNTFMWTDRAANYIVREMA